MPGIGASGQELIGVKRGVSIAVVVALAEAYIVLPLLAQPRQS